MRHLSFNFLRLGATEADSLDKPNASYDPFSDWGLYVSSSLKKLEIDQNSTSSTDPNLSSSTSSFKASFFSQTRESGGEGG